VGLAQPAPFKQIWPAPAQGDLPDFFPPRRSPRSFEELPPKEAPRRKPTAPNNARTQGRGRSHRKRGGTGFAMSRLHSRRSDRHTRHRQPDCLRLSGPPVGRGSARLSATSRDVIQEAILPADVRNDNGDVIHFKPSGPIRSERPGLVDGTTNRVRLRRTAMGAKLFTSGEPFSRNNPGTGRPRLESVINDAS
jgi:hypothetical protein